MFVYSSPCSLRSLCNNSIASSTLDFFFRGAFAMPLSCLIAAFLDCALLLNRLHLCTKAVNSSGVMLCRSCSSSTIDSNGASFHDLESVEDVGEDGVVGVVNIPSGFEFVFTVDSSEFIYKTFE